MLLGLIESSVNHVNTTSLALVSFATALVALYLWSQRKPARNFPPGPRGWPLIGSMLEFRKDPASTVFEQLGKEYGDIFSIRIGQMWTVVFNSSDVIKEALLKKAVEFADRPKTFSSEILTLGGKDIGFGQYTPTWKLHRKLAHTAFRTLATGNNERFENIVYSMTSRMEKVLEQKGDQPFDPKQVVSLAVYNFLASMCFGKSYEFDEPDLKEWISIAKALMDLSNGLPADYIPILRFVPTKGAEILKGTVDRFMKLIDKEFYEHRVKYDGGEPKDFMEILFKTKQDMIDEGSEQMDLITDTHMKLTVFDIFSGGTDTTIYTLHWAIGMLAEYPEIQEKVAKEIDDVIGRDRGYFIPKGITCLFNLQAMHFDKNHWDEPEKFTPEHFLDEAGSVRLHPDSFMPFSAGRRVCVGESLAKAELFLLFTWLFQHYSFSKPPGKEKVSLDHKLETALGNIIKEYEIVAKKRF